MTYFSHPHRHNAFTLIEVLMYSALVSVIVGMFLASTSLFINSGHRDLERAAVIANYRFLDFKLDRLLTGLDFTTVSPASGSASSLTISPWLPIFTQLTRVDIINNRVRITRDTNFSFSIDNNDVSYFITDSHVKASNMIVDHLTLNGQAAIRMRVTLQGVYSTFTFDKTVYIK